MGGEPICASPATLLSFPRPPFPPRALKPILWGSVGDIAPVFRCGRKLSAVLVLCVCREAVLSNQSASEWGGSQLLEKVLERQALEGLWGQQGGL